MKLTSVERIGRSQLISVFDRREVAMIGWLKDIVVPIRLDDPQFGRMRYLRDTRTWEGWTTFSPVRRQVEVLLSGEPGGPSRQQRDFLRTLEGRYEGLLPAVTAALSEAATLERGVDASTPAYILVAVDLPAELQEDVLWELCYETEPKSRFFAVQMRGWLPQNVSVEC